MGTSYHTLYALNFASSDYQLFRSMQHNFANFKTYEEIKKWLDE